MTRKVVPAWVVGVILLAATPAQADEGELLAAVRRDVRVHDPSTIVRCEGEYWFFATGHGIASWRSKDLQDWQRGPRVMPKMPSWVQQVVPQQRGHYWAPDVIFRDGKYWLYYSVSSFGKNRSAIALATNVTLDPDSDAFEWIDQGIVLESKSSDDFNAIDPAVIQTGSGELWMSFGSFWSGLKLVQLDTETGKCASDAKLHSIAKAREIEAPFIYQRDGWFYLFVNHGLCCRGLDSTYEILVGRSRSITGPFVDREHSLLSQGGGTLLVGADGDFIGAGHASIVQQDGKSWLGCHVYDGTDRGKSKLALLSLTWSEDGWPLIDSRTNQR
ncbi:arabinan endo-1,5-alpha-L-arabinosidase [Bremerella sp. JC770]|uniref:arabinan endo-1,5-alpha-L-arabinosidase n=1 Tax=Bremerella sp. JC770 TaxID=3232137 RepID=UPI00345B4009